MSSGPRGVLLVLTGPSGVGKSTLVQRLRSVVPDLDFSVSATTRAARPGERDGIEYHFIDDGQFAALRTAGALLEHATVYDRSYGTPRAPVEAALHAGRVMLLDIDVRGALQVRASMPEAVLVFLAPPDRVTLLERLRARGTEDEAVVLRRMAQAAEQLQGVVYYDYVVVNDVLEHAADALLAIVRAERYRLVRRPGDVARTLHIARSD